MWELQTQQVYKKVFKTSPLLLSGKLNSQIHDKPSFLSISVLKIMIVHLRRVVQIIAILWSFVLGKFGYYFVTVFL